MTAEEFQQISHTIPVQAGIYKYYGEEGELLYVGKAKSLRKRVSSYFVKNHDSFKTRKLVQSIHHIEFTIVNSEQDAFLLENSLIKQFQPRYNINLKDDKTYPYIVIKHEAYPRVFLTRNVIRDGSEYLGPFTSVGRVRELLEVIRYNIPLRTCNLSLTEQNIRKGKFKVCLEYHLGNCKGPCEGLQTEEDYRAGLQQVKDILKVGQEVEARVIKVDKVERRIGLSIKAANYSEEQLRKEVESFDTLRPGEDMVGLEKAFAAAEQEEYRPGESKRATKDSSESDGESKKESKKK